MAELVKEKHLHIRASAEEKTALARAARLRTQKISQFVLMASLQEAEKVLAEQTSALILTPEQYDTFAQRLDEAPCFLPNLAAQFAKVTPFRD